MADDEADKLREQAISGANLQSNASSEHLDVIMPSFAKPAATSTLSFSLETLSAVVKTQDLIPTLAKNIAFIGVKSAGGMIASVLVSEFFDTALADMLDTIGDVSLRAAVRALREAQGEPSQAIKTRHRHTAEGLLRSAFDGYESSLKARDSKFFTFSGDKDVVLHEKAMQAALTIAAINREVGAIHTVAEWIESSKSHLLKAGVIIERHREFQVGFYNRRYGKGIRFSKALHMATDPYPGDTERRNRRDAEQAIARSEQFRQDMLKWGTLIRQLKMLE